MPVDLAALRRSLDGAGDVREAGQDDAVDGVLPSAVALPTSLGALSALLREAAGRGLVSVARGAGTALDWGAPPERVDLVVDVSGLDRIVEHEAGDLVVVTEAGVSLRTLDEHVGRAGQELVADVPRERFEAGSTVGGALATAATGPRRLQRLALRDLVLGVTVVLADGTVATSGGKVVKNVAGYDLAKLVTGSYGTLGVIARAAFRLHPVPPARAFVSRTAPLSEAAELARAVVASRLAPAAVEVEHAAGSDDATVAVLLEGTADAVAARAEETRLLIGGDVGPEPAWWSRMPSGDVIAKVTSTLVGVRAVLETARASEQRHGTAVAVRGSAAGVLHAGIGASSPATVTHVVTDLRSVAATPRDGTVVVLSAPAALRDGLDVWGPVPGLELMRGIKEQLDPGRHLAPGRFVGGI